MQRLVGKVAIITGAAGGIGAGIARRLVSEGAGVIITDIQADAGQMLAEELGCGFIRHDVTDEGHWNLVLKYVKERYGSLHLLVNNAGIEGPFDRAGPETTSLSDWRTINKVNVEGLFLGCRAAIPELRSAGGGSIINMSSTAALLATPDFVAYGASKAAIRHLTRSVALHCAKDGSRIRCNSVHPGVVLTPMLQRIIETCAKSSHVSVEQMTEDFRAAIPQGEFQDLEDIASAVVFLASDEARHITGLAMVVDGGCTIGLS